MARSGGGLDALTVAAIFVVVFAAMWAGTAYTRGELVDRDPPDARERRVGAALWDAIVDRRTTWGLDPPRRSTPVAVDARAVARALAEDRYGDGIGVGAPDGSTAGNATATGATGTDGATVGDPPEAGLHPSATDRCTQLVVAHAVDRPGWNGSDGGSDATGADTNTNTNADADADADAAASATPDASTAPPPEVVDAVVATVLRALVAADDHGVLRRTGTFQHGLGVVAEDDRLYVVYRSCAQRRVSP
jgi:hypothetical protein